MRSGARFSSFRLALLAGSAVLLTSGACAADAKAGAAPIVLADAVTPPETVETIVVTGRHRAENNQEVPLPISLIAGDKLKLEHADRIADYADKVPNFSAVQQNTRVSQFSIRGLGGNANFDGVESGVGLIVDNVVFTHVGFSWFDFVDLDHVEVLRGPQGHAARQEHDHRRRRHHDPGAQLHAGGECRGQLWQPRPRADPRQRDGADHRRRARLPPDRVGRQGQWLDQEQFQRRPPAQHRPLVGPRPVAVHGPPTISATG